MKIIISRLAYDAIAAIGNYIAIDDPPAAWAMEDAIIKKIDELREFPNRGRAGEVAGTREILVPNTPYIVIYKVVGEKVLVATVWHERQSRDE